MPPTLHLAGEIAVPGDKSITHRALLLAGIAAGRSRIRGPGAGEDCRSTARVLRQLGAEISELALGAGEVRVRSRGAAHWTTPPEPLDCGNSGTTARLLMGALAGAGARATLTGDASLRARPMRRITLPLERMGARVRELGPTGRLPLEVVGGELHAIRYDSPVPSAQVKSALLLAGLTAGVRVLVREALLSRDHTERMLRGLGVALDSRRVAGGWEAELLPPDRPLPPLDIRVPGDPSAAAFLVALALLAPAGELRIRGVGISPTRSAFLAVARRMGGHVTLENQRDEGGEPVADLVVHAGAHLRATDIPPEEVPALIDEIPVLAVLAARAEGETRIHGAAELRVKETDRIAALAAGLRTLGAEAEETEDGLVIPGSDRPLAGRVETHGDHRIAMAFGVLGALPGNRVAVDQPAVADVSFPGFWEVLRGLTAPGAAPKPAPRPPPRRGIVVAIDGPAGSGKSSTARAVAAALGYRHLDSGAFYRALTWAALRAGTPPEEWARLTPVQLERLRVTGTPAGPGYRLRVDGTEVDAELRSAEVNAHVSRMAAVPAVREWLLGALREAGRGGALVADGRDIGTVVFPGAELKAFLVCDADERARRRLGEQGAEGATPGQVRAEAERLGERDRLDSTRAVAPLAPAPDAVVVDTTYLGFREQVERVVALARERGAGVDPIGGNA